MGVVTWCLLALVHWCPPVLLCHRVMIIVISVTTDDNVTLCLSLDVTDHSGLTLAPWGAGRDWPGLVCSHSLWLQPLSSHWPLWAPSSSSSQFSVLCWLVRAPAPGPQCWPGSLATAPLPATSHGQPCTPCTPHLQLSEKEGEFLLTNLARVRRKQCVD